MLLLVTGWLTERLTGLKIVYLWARKKIGVPSTRQLVLPRWSVLFPYEHRVVIMRLPNTLIDRHCHFTLDW